MGESTVAAAAIGYQGFGNLGDEAILAGIEVLLAQTPIHVTAVIVGDRAPVAAFSGARRFAARRLVPQPRTLAALRGVRVLFFTGGGLIHDHWPLVIPQYLAWSFLARLFRRRIVWLGVGIGPLRTRRSRWLARLTLTLASAVTVRDEASRVLAQGLGRPDAMVIPDPAIYNARPAPAPRSGLAIVVRALPRRKRGAQLALERALVEFVSDHVSRAERVVIMTFGGAMDQRLAGAIATKAASGASIVELDELPPEPASALQQLASFDAIVTVRLHGLVLASLARTPWVAIAYDEKVEGVAASLGADRRRVIPLEGLTGNALESAVRYATSEAARASIEMGVERLRSRMDEVRLLVTTAAVGVR